jgi:hypothetical protein
MICLSRGSVQLSKLAIAADVMSAGAVRVPDDGGVLTEVMVEAV